MFILGNHFLTRATTQLAFFGLLPPESAPNPELPTSQYSVSNRGQVWNLVLCSYLQKVTINKLVHELFTFQNICLIEFGLPLVWYYFCYLFVLLWVYWHFYVVLVLLGLLKMLLTKAVTKLINKIEDTRPMEVLVIKNLINT